MTDGLTVAQHYGTAPLLDRFDEALRQAGLGGGTVDWSDLSALDQFHARGLAATKELAAELLLTPSTTVLDVGSGLGGPARYLAATYGCHVTGVDLSQSFVDVANMLAERAGLAERVAYRQADALRLPFDDESFDHAWTQHVAMNIQDRPRLYGEIRRVIRPGGMLAIYDVIAGEGDVAFPVPWARRPGISFLLTATAMRETVEAAGFSVVSWTDKTQAAIEWFAAQSPAGGQVPKPGLGVAMGPEFARMSANMAWNLREGRIRLVQAVVKRA